VAYIPVGLIGALVSPDMLPLLMDNKDVVLVIEDAEKALLSRDVSGNSEIVSTILNLTDGFIGDALNISIIATFNTEKENIDQALLRKGRLRLSYEFKKLSKEDGRTLARSIGKPEENITGEMSLAEIYNMDDDTGYKEIEQRRVGFC
jgi:ATP-dependent 26S proteasome regulatory subunit